jgi:hypothetical protein
MGIWKGRLRRIRCVNSPLALWEHSVRQNVGEEEARKTAKTLGCRFLEWSAKEGDGGVLNGLVSDIVGDIMRQRVKGASLERQ